jgi:ATP-dependent helicase/nuclease subunit B
VVHPLASAPTPISPARPSRLLESLAEEASDGAPGRRLVVGSTRGEARELLRALARERGSWVGLVPTTLRPVALEIAGAELSQGRRLLDDFDEHALLDELLDEALEATPAAHLSELAEGVGFRRAVREAVGALRLAGVDGRRLARAHFGDPARGRVLTHIFGRFEERIAAERLADTATLLTRATRALEEGAPLPADRILLLPGLGTRGWAGRFVAALQTRGARRLAADHVHGIDAPAGLLWLGEEAGAPFGDVYDNSRGGERTPPAQGTLALFRAAGVTEELREVLRRVLEAGLRWDEVEIVTPDAGAYGPALHALAGALGVPVTFAVGLPIERTRPGRAVAGWLRWVLEDFPAAVLRGLLESGDLAPPGRHRSVDGARLARRLRRLRIGWGRARYLPAIDIALRRVQAEGPRIGREEEPEEAERRFTREVAELEALRALLRPILDATPPLPRRHDPAPARVAPGDLARGLARFLERVPPGGSVDETALERLGRILDRVQATLVRATSFRAALAVLEEHLAIRVPAPRAEGRAPWGSAGGHLHLSDVEHGGFSGRRTTFIVGLDAGRFPGAGGQDPILLDAERSALAPRDLPGSGDRLEERRFRMAALLARLRGAVTLSWPAWEPSEGRSLGPSSVLLQAFRRLLGAPDATFGDLEAHVGDPLSRIPRGAARLDDDDVWLGALARGGRLLAGEAVVRAAHPWLDAGLAAKAARHGVPSAHHGIVSARAALDPRSEPRPILSSTRLERLGQCPLSYYYDYVLGASPPDDPVFDPERWLDPLRRGSLLHTVYERLLSEARRQGIDWDDPELDEVARAMLEQAAAQARLEVPPPSEAVHQREMEELRREVGSFLGMVRHDRPEWIETELRFGFADGGRPAVELRLPRAGRILLRGAVDRVDHLPAGGLKVVDYKTGSAGRFFGGGTYNGGRRLQAVLYSEVVERLLGARVERMEYHFPTRKGENQKRPFLRVQLRGGLELLERLLDVAASGRFLPTEDAGDCAFCDFRHACRVREGRSEPDSPMAEWAAQRIGDDAYELIRGVRRFEEL